MSDRLRCKICGKEYEGCKSARIPHSGYRWQDVACCPEHGAMYLEAILKSRGELKEAEEVAAEETKEEQDIPTKTKKKKTETKGGN